MISSVNLSDIGRGYLLRCGSKYVDFWKNQEGKIFDVQRDSIILKEFVCFSTGKIIKKDQIDKVYQLIDLANIEPEIGIPIGLENNVVSEIGSDKVYLSDSELIFSKLNSHIGYVFLKKDIPDNGYEIIGSTEFYPLLVDSSVIHPKLLKYYLLHSIFRQKAVFLRSGKSQSHPRIQKEDFFNISVPYLSKEVQKKILAVIEDIEDKIKELREKVKTLHSIIDSVLIRYNVKDFYDKKHKTDILKTNFLNAGENKFLRLGARYHAFWEVHKGLLFDDANLKHPIYKLGDIIALHKTEILKKGHLSEEYILLDLEDLEPLTGRILNEENIVEEIGSDKVVFGDCDIVTGKLRPYLGYTIINDKDKPYIGTTELLPFKIKKHSKVLAQYIQYLLLSQEYISKSEFLMSGKEHPRIHPSDLLNIKVPIPDIKIQEKIVEEIKDEESRSFEHRQEIKRLRAKIDAVIYEAITNG